MITTLGKAKSAFSWSQFTNLCSSDSRLVLVLNEAVMRLRQKGLWVGTTKTFQVCGSNACLTWPRQIETIELAWLCTRPITIRNEWFESLPNGFGRLKSDASIGNQLVDRGSGYVCHTDIVVARKIALFDANPADAGKTVLIQGRDSGANWVSTNGGATDGELLTLIAGLSGYKVSATTWSPPGIVGVQKQATLGPVRAYAVLPACPSGTVADISTFDPIAIAYWEPDELLPDYRRSLIPNLQSAGPCSSNDNGCEKTQITVYAKLQFIPAVKDTDYLQIGNLPALKEMVQSILKGERGLISEAEAHETRAVRLLEEELMSNMGHGVTQPFKVEDSALFGAGAIENPVNSWDYPFSR